MEGIKIRNTSGKRECEATCNLETHDWKRIRGKYQSPGTDRLDMEVCERARPFRSAWMTVDERSHATFQMRKACSQALLLSPEDPFATCVEFLFQDYQSFPFWGALQQL